MAALLSATLLVVLVHSRQSIRSRIYALCMSIPLIKRTHSLVLIAILDRGRSIDPETAQIAVSYIVIEVRQAGQGIWKGETNRIYVFMFCSAPLAPLGQAVDEYQPQMASLRLVRAVTFLGAAVR